MENQRKWNRADFTNFKGTWASTIGRIHIKLIFFNMTNKVHRQKITTSYNLAASLETACVPTMLAYVPPLMYVLHNWSWVEPVNQSPAI